ncbi:hypothetical protein [Embleya sp. NPDC001921]
MNNTAEGALIALDASRPMPGRAGQAVVDLDDQRGVRLVHRLGPPFRPGGPLQRAVPATGVGNPHGVGDEAVPRNPRERLAHPGMLELAQGVQGFDRPREMDVLDTHFGFLCVPGPGLRSVGSSPSGEGAEHGVASGMLVLM